jgi:hypothetical protein
MPDDPATLRALAHDPGGKSKPRWPFGSQVNAVFSDCNKYRYALSEIWNETKPIVMFLMMNPSVAGVEHSDPTLIRTGNFARLWGYGGQLVGNIHAYRVTDSKLLATIADPVGPECDLHLFQMAQQAEMVVLAYGLPPKALRPRATQIVRLLREAGHRLTYLRLSKDGTPSHPLYLPGNLVPQEYIP